MRRLWLVLLAALVACPPAEEVLDAGAPPARDAGATVDAGPPDAGRPALDDPADAQRDLGNPPIARRELKKVTMHGDTLEDELAWLKGSKGTPELDELLAAENAYTDAWFEPYEALEDTIDKEFAARHPDVVDEARVPWGGHVYWTRHDIKLEHAQYYRAPRVGKGKEQLMLDLNTVAPDASYVDDLDLMVSDDGNRLAWAIDTTGARSFTLSITELRTNKVLPDHLTHVTSYAWAADNKTLFVTTENEAKRPFKVWRYEVGSKQPAEPIFEEPDERFEVAVWRTNSRRYVVIDSHSFTTSEARVIDAKKPKAPQLVILPRRQGLRYTVEDHGDRWVILSDDVGPWSRVFTIPLVGAGNVEEIVPPNPKTPITGMDVLDKFLVVWERVEGEAKPRAIDWATKQSQSFGAAGLLMPEFNLDYGATTYRYSAQSPVQPETIYARDLVKQRDTIVWQAPVPGFEPANYLLQRTWATSKDGTAVPITLAKRVNVGANAPLLLEGYGAYGDPLKPAFSNWAVSLLDRGVVLAFAHVRGGGEFGEAWHDLGRRENKQNSFDDFIACAEALIAGGHTSPGKLVITGMSAGGLLMGAVLNQRPDLFRGAVVEVPFVDVMNTMLDTSLPLTVGEFDEWGDPREPAAWARMKAYSPYDNVRAQNYPPILVRGALNDTQVLFHEPTKWVQRLRARKTDKNRVLLWMSTKPAGHGGQSSRSGAAADELRRQVWMLSQWGLAK